MLLFTINIDAREYRSCPGELNGFADISLSKARTCLDSVIIIYKQILQDTQEEERRSQSFSIVSPPNNNQRQDSDYSENFILYSEKDLERRLNNLDASSFQFTQRIISSGTIITPHWNEVIQVFDYFSPAGKNIKHYPDYCVTKVIFHDGSSWAAPKKCEGEILNYGTLIPIKRPIKRIKFRLNYTVYDSIQQIMLTPTHPQVKMANGESYRLIKMEDKQTIVLLRMPGKTQYVIEGLDEEGRALKLTNMERSWYGGETEEIESSLTRMIQAQDHFSQFKDSQELLHDLQGAPENGDMRFSTQQHSLNFSTPPHSLKIHVLSQGRQQFFTDWASDYSIQGKVATERK